VAAGRGALLKMPSRSTRSFMASNCARSPYSCKIVPRHAKNCLPRNANRIRYLKITFIQEIGVNLTEIAHLAIRRAYFEKTRPACVWSANHFESLFFVESNFLTIENFQVSMPTIH
jgi:hypothetical protein